MLGNFKKKIKFFFNDNTSYPAIAIIVAGVYALLYYYDKNYALINSKSQFVFLVSLYILLPLFLYYGFSFIFKKVAVLKDYKRFLLPIFNLSSFLITIVISLYGFDTVKMLIALVLGIIIGSILVNHVKKVIIVQLILICMVLPKLVPDLYREVMYSKDWMKQPDAIETTVFKKRPNVYVIQPDGYVNFSELTNKLYNFNNEIFENFLRENGFVFYPEYRSNYSSTLSSNSSLFGMKHHYYGNKVLGINPSHNTRDEIVGDNPVLRIFKNNDYKTLLMLQTPYLLVNRPKIHFDYCNISLNEVSYIERGFYLEKDLSKDVKTAIRENKSTSNFFFIESMLPSHIVTHNGSGNTVEEEGKLYIERLQEANKWLTDLIDYISKEDRNGIILIVSDHGGYVGLSSMEQNQLKQTNRDIVYSMFSSALAIKWNSDKPEFKNEIRSSVNLFRTVFAHLSEEQSYLNHLQEDKSYMIIRSGSPKGVYEYIDESGTTIFKKYIN